MILPFKPQFKDKILSGIKTTTIRQDSKNRWQKGRLIDFATGVRTKNYNYFGTSYVTDIYPIKLEPGTRTIYLKIDIGDGARWLKVVEDARENLIKCEGFEDEKEFWEFFPNDFTGKLISWNPFYLVKL